MPGQIDLFGLTTLDFGTIIAGSTADVVVAMQNSGDEDVSIADLASISGARYTISVQIPIPITLHPGGSTTLTIRYSPTVATTDTGTLSIFSNAINTPTTLPIMGKAIAAGGALQADPNGYQFPDTLITTLSAEKLFVIKNTGSANVTLNNPIVAAIGWTVTTDPTPVTIGAGGSATVGIKFAPTISQFYYSASGISISNTSGVNPFLVPLSGLGIPIISAYDVSPSPVSPVLIAFTDILGHTLLKQVTPTTPTNIIGPEIQGQVFKTTNLGTPGLSKTVCFLGIKYEALGTCTFFIQVLDRGGNAFQSQLTTKGLTDGTTQQLFTGNLPALGEIVTLIITLSASAGPLSIVDIFFVYDDMRPRIGSAALPTNLTPAYSITGVGKACLVGFGDSSLKQTASGVACEVNSTGTKILDYWFPQADFPIRGYEKTTYRLEVYYEDLGNFTLELEMKNGLQRGMDSSQTLPIIGLNDGLTKYAIFDLNVTGELQQMVLTRTSGICSIVLLIISIQPGSEVTKNT